MPPSEALVPTLPIDRTEALGRALLFFFCDMPKVNLLPTAFVFTMEMISSRFMPDRTRAVPAGRAEGAPDLMASTLGIVAPSRSCFAVPLFIGFVQAGVPRGVTFSFLISAPVVNEVATAQFLGLFG